MLALLPLTACAFSAPGLSPLVGHACMPSRAAVFAKAAEVADAVAMDAAANVLKASKKFGKPQVAAAQKWIEGALAGEQSVSLMEQKLTLFEQCQLDDESGVCKECVPAPEPIWDHLGLLLLTRSLRNESLPPGWMRH